MYTKYKNTKQTYDGYSYMSKLESAYAQQLDLRVKAKDIKGWRRQEKIRLDVNGKHICNYYMDFVIEHNDNSEEFVEVKGFETEAWRLKWKLFCALYPDEKKTILYAKDI
jgi:hypothetical protein